MFLLQEAIIGGMIIMIVIGIAFLIGVPVVTILLKNVFNSKADKSEVQKIDLDSKTKTYKIQKANTLFLRIFFAIIIIFILVNIAIIIFDSIFPGFE